MTPQERDSTLKLLAAVRKGYPNTKADAETLIVYVEALSDLTFAQVKAGLMLAMRKSKFFPTVAEICEAAEAMTAHANGHEKPDAGKAWGEVMKYIMRRGPYDGRPFPWTCEEIHEAVKRIGPMTLFEMTNDDVPTVRAQFRQIYNGVLSEKKDRKVMDTIGKRLGADYTALIDSTTKMLGMDGGRELPQGEK